MSTPHLEPVAKDLVEKVKTLLPPQPWKPGMNRRLAEELKCRQSDVSAAVSALVDDGVFLRQENGVLYDCDGNVVAFDPERVDPDTLQLRDDRA
jgi:hypothetical protein